MKGYNLLLGIPFSIILLASTKPKDSKSLIMDLVA